MARLVSDPALAARMGAAGRRRADRYTAACVVPAFEELYAELLRARSHEPRMRTGQSGIAGSKG
jgi:hypothetical protein